MKPYIRKKAVLLMYKIFLRYPDALRPAFPRLKEKLEDPDPGATLSCTLWKLVLSESYILCPGVQSAAVNVICELARKNPKNYLSLAPLFFKLMTTSTNNWVLIKIIKLVRLQNNESIKISRLGLTTMFLLQFGALTPLEPRLGKKLIEPLTNLIHR